MGLEGLTAARSRIAEIESSVGNIAGVGPRVGRSAGAATMPATNFNDVLNSVTAGVGSGSGATSSVAGGALQPGTGSGSIPSSKFAVDVLAKLAMPQTQENVRAIVAWAKAEGTSASFNPLATTRTAANTTDFNSVGVKNYPSYDEGVDATVATLRNGRYPNILAAFANGNDAMAVARAVEASPWGTGHGVVRVLNNHD